MPKTTKIEVIGESDNSECQSEIIKKELDQFMNPWKEKFLELDSIVKKIQMTNTRFNEKDINYVSICRKIFCLEKNFDLTIKYFECLEFRYKQLLDIVENAEAKQEPGGVEPEEVFVSEGAHQRERRKSNNLCFGELEKQYHELEEMNKKNSIQSTIDILKGALEISLVLLMSQANEVKKNVDQLCKLYLLQETQSTSAGSSHHPHNKRSHGKENEASHVTAKRKDRKPFDHQASVFVFAKRKLPSFVSAPEKTIFPETSLSRNISNN